MSDNVPLKQTNNTPEKLLLFVPLEIHPALCCFTEAIWTGCGHGFKIYQLKRYTYIYIFKSSKNKQTTPPNSHTTATSLKDRYSS